MIKKISTNFIVLMFRPPLAGRQSPLSGPMAGGRLSTLGPGTSQGQQKNILEKNGDIIVPKPLVFR